MTAASGTDGHDRYLASRDRPGRQGSPRLTRQRSGGWGVTTTAHPLRRDHP